tara:strand:+ start:395 stop:622 length:228 start_codon:yes stop_codon:yes gene_type:complete
MYVSESFGRHFWVDEEDQFRSAGSFIDGTADMDNADYVSDWEDWEGVNYDLLFAIYRTELHNKWSYANSLSHNGV